MDHFLINARPQPFDVNPYAFTLTKLVSTVPTIIVEGRSFINVTNIYLSSIDVKLFTLSTTYINPFSAIANLSASNIGFSGIDISDFSSINSLNYITIQLPYIFQESNYFDIIIQNEAGFGILSRDSTVPFVSAWKGATNIQKPCVSGIRVSII